MNERELLNGLQRQNSTAPIREVMRNNLPAIHADEPLYLALEEMVKNWLGF